MTSSNIFISPQLELYDSDGILVASDVSSNEALIEEVLLKGGVYTILVSDQFSDDTGEYMLSLTLILGECLPIAACTSDLIVNDNPVPLALYQAGNSITSSGDSGYKSSSYL